MDLTPRECQVLELIAEGLGNREIGRRLGITRKTVTTHLTHIYQALHVTNRTEATRALLLQRIQHLERENAVLRRRTLDQADLRGLAHYATAVSRALETEWNGDR